MLKRFGVNELLTGWSSCWALKIVGSDLDSDITKMSTPAVSHWLQKFVIEVRKVSGEHYCPDSLHQICYGLQRALRAADWVDINFFEISEFALFWYVLDGELKQLNATGKYMHEKKAEVMNSTKV